MTDFTEVKLKRQDQAVTLAIKSCVSIGGKTIHIDLTLLFQRLLKIAEINPETLPASFDYELTNVPTSLFEPSGLPREAQKHVLAEYL